MQFHTATINSWKDLLFHDSFKDVIVNCLDWLGKNNRAYTHAFVIMPNHIHLLWTVVEGCPQPPPFTLASYTAHEFKKQLKQNHPDLLNEYLSTQCDRDYHFWERRPKTIDISSREMAFRVMNYIHNNPLQQHWKLSPLPEDYRYSSASFYLKEESEFKFIKHVMDFL